jgi:membrane protein DedA with SNARE-associated domain
MTATPETVLLALGSSTAAVVVAIIVTSFLMEDLATVGAAMLAAAGTISPALAASSLFIGIFLGDLSLYAAGAWARRNAWALRQIGPERLQRGRNWLQQRYVISLITARCLPGMRLPTFAASGFLNLPFSTFFAVLLLAGVAWTTVLFLIVYNLGVGVSEALGPWRWLAAAALVLLAIIGPQVTRRILSRRG